MYTPPNAMRKPTGAHERFRIVMIVLSAVVLGAFLSETVLAQALPRRLYNLQRVRRITPPPVPNVATKDELRTVEANQWDIYYYARTGDPVTARELDRELGQAEDPRGRRGPLPRPARLGPLTSGQLDTVLGPAEDPRGRRGPPPVARPRIQQQPAVVTAHLLKRIQLLERKIQELESSLAKRRR